MRHGVPREHVRRDRPAQSTAWEGDVPTTGWTPSGGDAGDAEADEGPRSDAAMVRWETEGVRFPAGSVNANYITRPNVIAILGLNIVLSGTMQSPMDRIGFHHRALCDGHHMKAATAGKNVYRKSANY